MGKMSREEKLFRNENSVLQHYKAIAVENHSHDEASRALKELTGKYERLLNQTRFLTWISGRLERKLQRKNKELSDSNQILQNTLKELTKAEAGKSAYAIIYFIAIILFVLEEVFIEPLVDAVGGNVGYGILIKLMIVLLLKVSEGFIEKKIIHSRKPATPHQ
ncbi:MAG: hypothetical protein ABJA70_22760 [Chryseolinea sp.]